jgi:hypothetical protein
MLLQFVFKLALRMAVDYGCIGVIVDAKPASVDFYRRLGFVELEVLEGQLQKRPRATAMFLSINEIKAAM